MSLLQEFKAFAMRGNVVDMAVGIVIGGALGKIVSSFVADVLMPPIGLLLGGMDFSNLAVTLKAAEGTEAVMLKYGVFVQTVVDFIIIAFAIFIVVKAMNSMKKKEEAAPPPAPPELRRQVGFGNLPWIPTGESHMVRTSLLRPLCALLFLLPSLALAHGKSAAPAANAARSTDFPDIAGAVTLVTDLHTHSVFSDGHVWPRIRVEESLRDGLDAMAVTEHLEYQPHRVDLPHQDRNRAVAESEAAAAGTDLMIISGSEITREAPAGHMNAVFVKDSNALLKLPAAVDKVTDAIEVYRAAHGWPADEAVKAATAQGAFVFWNHPYWTAQNPDGIARLDPFHAALIRSRDLHGIEIANGEDYSEEAHQIALDHDLVMIGVSDVHELIDWDYLPEQGGHRPVTLVFAKERSPEALRDALFAKRTVVWFKNLLIGREPELKALLDVSLTLDPAITRYRNVDVAEVTLVNHSDAELILDNTSDHTFMADADLISVPPHGRRTLAVKLPKSGRAVEIGFIVRNALLAPGKPATIAFSGTLPAPG